MKKFLGILLILIFLAAAGAAVFLLTLDADQYRPAITEQLEKALGKPVKMEKISFAWSSGVTLSLKGLVIGSDAGFRDELIRVDSANAVLNLRPLLNREIQISSINIKEPRIQLIKKADGSFLGFEPKVQAAAAAASPQEGRSDAPAQAAAALSFLVNEIQISSGEIFFRDESGPQIAETRLRDIDLTIENAALDQSVGVTLKAALLSSRQNVHLKGAVKFSVRTQTLTLENFRGDLDLASLDLQALSRLLPGMSESGMEQVSGNLEIEAGRRVVLDNKLLQNADMSFQLREGGLKLAGLADQINRLTADLALQEGFLKIRKVSADFAGGNFRGEGQVNLNTPKPLTSLNLNLQRIPVGALTVRSHDAAAPVLEGMLSGDFQGTFSGSSEIEIPQTLKGEGKIVIEEAVIRNLNILQEVFRKLSMIPGLVDNLRKRLPENYQEKLDEKDTHLQTVQLPLSARDGAVTFNSLDVKTDSFALQGAGSYAIMSSSVRAQANLYVEPDLSAAFIRSVKELEYLTDRKTGALMFPLTVQGRVPQIAVVPDLQYIASRLAVAKTQDLLGGLLKSPQSEDQNPLLGQTNSRYQAAGEESVQGSASAPAKLPKGKDLIGAFLQNALQGDSGNSDASDSSNSRTRSSLF